MGLDSANLSSRWQAKNLGSATFGDNFMRIDETLAIGFTNGSGANQATELFTDYRTIAASATDALDLNGTLVDHLGQTVNFTKVKALRFRADAANPGDLLIGPAATNGFVSPFNAAADRIRCAPGGVVELINPTAAGWAVTAGTGDILNVVNSSAGGSASYKLEIIGA